MAMPFTVEVFNVHGATRVVLGGELDHGGVDVLEKVFRTARAVDRRASVVIDVSDLEFCDSAGWHSLERCCDDGARLFGSPPCLRRLFYLIRNAHKLPPELHELRGLEPGAALRLPSMERKAA